VVQLLGLALGLQANAAEISEGPRCKNDDAISRRSWRHPSAGAAAGATYQLSRVGVQLQEALRTLTRSLLRMRSRLRSYYGYPGATAPMMELLGL
jgi:hypothetical protein